MTKERECALTSNFRFSYGESRLRDSITASNKLDHNRQDRIAGGTQGQHSLLTKNWLNHHLTKYSGLLFLFLRAGIHWNLSSGDTLGTKASVPWVKMSPERRLGSGKYKRTMKTCFFYSASESAPVIQFQAAKSWLTWLCYICSVESTVVHQFKWDSSCMFWKQSPLWLVCTLTYQWFLWSVTFWVLRCPLNEG